jgi:hypothetical protein
MVRPAQLRKAAPKNTPGNVNHKNNSKKVGFAVSVSHSYLFIINILHTKSLYGIFAFVENSGEDRNRVFSIFAPPPVNGLVHI